MICGVALRFPEPNTGLFPTLDNPQDFIWLDKPCRHNNLFPLAKQLRRDLIGSEQGFWIWGPDNKRKYLTREQAWDRVVKCEQLLPNVRQVEGVLFSENVW